MRQFVTGFKVQGAAALAVLSLSGSLTAGQIDSVCKTDDQTLTSIKTDPDQTLWVFMQTVCQGQFDITQTPENSPTLALLQPEERVAVPPIIGTASPSRSTLSSIRTTNSLDQVVTAEAETEEPPSRTTGEIPPPTADTFQKYANLDARKEGTKQIIRAQISTEQNSDEALPDKVDASLYRSELRETPADESPTDEEDGSNRPWIYSLLGSQDLPANSYTLPSPIEYEPNKFSIYKPHYLEGTVASTHGRALIQKPNIMSVTPHGLFASLYWHSYEEPGVMKQSGPGFALGFVDERAIREWKDYPGMGSRLELGRVRVNYKGTGEFTNNAYYLLGEAYQPLSYGFFAGLGYRRLYDRKIPDELTSINQVLTSTGYWVYDRISEYVYLPIGIAGKNSDNSTYKFQINALIKGQQTSRFWRDDGDVKKEQKKGWGFDLAYAPSDKGEVFLRYWNIEDSEITVGPVTGKRWIEPKNETVEAGIRAWW